MAFDIFWMNVAAVFALLNVGLVVALIVFYLQSWRRLHSSLSIALVLFAFFFLIQNSIIVVFWYILYNLDPSAQPIVLAAAPYLTAINLAESLGLGNLVRVTWR